jgi:hypothetical protein
MKITSSYGIEVNKNILKCLQKYIKVLAKIYKNAV